MLRASLESWGLLAVGTALRATGLLIAVLGFALQGKALVEHFDLAA